jgi:hypothetical protein
VISRGVFIVVLAALASGCASGAAPSDRVARAWKVALDSQECPEWHMITADRRSLTFIVSGCGVVERVQVECFGEDCSRRVQSLTKLDQPRRLRTTDGSSWVDPAHVGPTGELLKAEPTTLPPTAPRQVAPGQRLNDMNAPAHKPTLPKEINRAGIVVWGLYKVCIGAEGRVHAVSIIKSALPGGMDAHWISRIETFEYRPYSVDGRPVPFCHPLRLEVRSVS